jgi:hypothetical protein
MGRSTEEQTKRRRALAAAIDAYAQTTSVSKADIARSMGLPGPELRSFCRQQGMFSMAVMDIIERWLRDRDVEIDDYAFAPPKIDGSPQTSATAGNRSLDPRAIQEFMAQQAGTTADRVSVTLYAGVFVVICPL